MNGRKSFKVIFDTNIWISFLIGKRLQFIKDLIGSQQLIIILSERLLLELKLVTQRPKLKKYFPEQKVEELIRFLLVIGQVHEPNVSNYLSRDPKDDFLLDLAEISKADYWVTGDNDLLVLNPFKNTQIMTPADFEAEVRKAAQ
jgi:uncharacterized protein